MELREIETFLVLADELHFGRTARRLNLSQSRVSQLIRALERRIGASLFDRTSRTVTLTPIGARLRDGLGPTYAQLNAVVEDARREAERRTRLLRIGCAGAAGGDWLTDAIESFRAGRPGCRVVLAENPLVDPYGPLLRGEADLLVARLPVEERPELTVGPAIAREERLLAVPAGHPLAERGSASVEDLADLGVFALRSSPEGLSCPFVPLYTPGGRLIPRRGAFSSYSEMLELVARREGVHPLAVSLLKFHRHPGVVFVPIPDLPPVEVALVWPTDDRNTDVRAFTAIVNGARAA
ncbi:LysR family transcriptional regulator [Microbispora sp. NBRC 16548]|uniref:LysR family transcriptional regulator n=1 Tax=Microbispora sp. NBRC 16548 TaxID=3030994 RepID=UPI0024A16B9E|nr:LysR family transcriptional regulator [Microbispora sp. NBRC 16548]GLX03602.1 LysR family transcriptional regulator [Microbispora sp. NBRC 16548]